MGERVAPKVPVDVTEIDINNLLGLFNETITFTYDAEGRLTEIKKETKDGKTVTYTIEYDAAGNISKITKTVS